MTIKKWGPRPAADDVGWCHSCGTFQRGKHARWTELFWEWDTWAWVCVNCEGEPWGLGVWRCSCEDCVDFLEDGHPAWAGPMPEDGGCWKVAHGECADALCSEYPGSCDGHD